MRNLTPIKIEDIEATTDVLGAGEASVELGWDQFQQGWA